MGNWTGVWGNINDLQHNTVAPSYENLFALTVTRYCNFVVKRDNLNLWTANKSVAVVKMMQRLYEIPTNIVFPNRVNCIVLTEIPTKCKVY